MKKNMKGFTLIELLAVIVILAIIALIATPIILNVIEEARLKAVHNSAYGLVSAAKLTYTESLYEGNPVASGNVEDLKVSGDKPTGGTWSIDTASGEVVLVDVVFGDYTCKKAVADSKVSCSLTPTA